MYLVTDINRVNEKSNYFNQRRKTFDKAKCLLFVKN